MEAYKAALQPILRQATIENRPTYCMTMTVSSHQLYGDGHVYDPKHIHGMNWLAFSHIPCGLRKQPGSARSFLT
jgi:hypothetical protein